jgi:hypothetical protein
VGWVVGTLLLLAAAAVVLGVARDASLGRKIGREMRNRDDRQDPPKRERPDP